MSTPPSEPLHTLAPTARFTDRAHDYALYRPSYPAEAIDAIMRAVEPSTLRPRSAADIGAGTGISARLLADRGVHVTAVEPNARMRAAAEPHPNITWHDGTAEATGLPDHSVDLVMCSQAFHWFDQQGALGELHRILRTGGVLALMWNDRDNTDPLTAEYSRLILGASSNHPAARDRSECGEVIRSTPLFIDARLEVFPYEQPLTVEGLIGRALSASYTPKHGPLHDALITGLSRAFKQHARPDGTALMMYRTRLYTAQRVHDHTS